jgi:hypothetical protein
MNAILPVIRLLPVLVVFLTATAMRGQVIVDYNGAVSSSGTGTSTPLSDFNATTVGANLTASALVANAPANTTSPFSVVSGNPSGSDSNIQKWDVGGPNTFGSESVDYFEFTANNSISNGQGATNEMSAKQVGSYFSFTVTAAAGYELDIASVNFGVAQLTTSDTALRGFALASSLDSASYSVDLAENNQITGFRAATGGWEQYSIDTSSMFQYQDVTGTVEFNFYGWTPTGGAGIGYNEITLDGEVVPVPEPAPAALCGLGALLAILIRRARR